MTMMTLRDFQALLIGNGYPMPEFGADGFYGAETERAFEDWGRADEPLALTPTPPEMPPVTGQIVPDDWMPDCNMERLILHWTAGANVASDHDRDSYHILIEGSGKLVRGKKTIKDNTSTADGVYAAHTKDCNTGSIGISLCGMAGAIEHPFYAGNSPINKAQWSVAAQVAADLVKKYGIPLDNKHVLSHGRVQANLGITQSGKWDICLVPWDASLEDEACDEAFRAEVRRYL